MTEIAQTLLAALTDGLPPLADPIECDDMRGPRSFFGESAPMPRPVADLSRCCALLRGDKNLRLRYGDCASLWHSDDGASALERARRVCGQGGKGDKEGVEADGKRRAPESGEGGSGRFSPGKDAKDLELDVPASTYLTGRGVSTFALAWKLFEDDMLPEWGAVLCSCQTEGRGRLRRAWHSPRGNLHVSFRLPADPLFRGDQASLFAGLLVLRALRKMGFDLHLKWPNDLLLDNGAKVGGILLEEKNGVLMAGLGLNLAEAPEADHLRQQAAVPAGLLLPNGEGAPGGGGHYDHLPPFPLWRRLVSEAVIEYDQYIAGREPAALLADINALLAWKQRPVLLREEGEPAAEGFFLGLGPSGGALLRLAGGEREFFSGSLSLHF